MGKNKQRTGLGNLDTRIRELLGDMERLLNGESKRAPVPVPVPVRVPRPIHRQ